MSVTIDVAYTGELTCQAIHAPSGATLCTDAPADNGGTGAHFSPTDLLATALASCMVTTMAIAARTHQIDMRGTHARVEKHMGRTPRRHVEKLIVHITAPAALDERARTLLERAAAACPVHASLATTTEVALTFAYEIQ